MSLGRCIAISSARIFGSCSRSRMLKAVCVVLCRDEKNSGRAKKEACGQRKEQEQYQWPKASCMVENVASP